MLETTLRITNSSDVGITGLTATEIKYRKTPFGSGDLVAPVSITGGTNGIYLSSFIGVAYQAVQVWISGVYQSDWGTKYVGDAKLEFLSITKTTEQDILSDIDMNSKKLKNLADGSADGDSVNFGQVVKNTGDEEIDGQKQFSEYPIMVFEAGYVAPVNAHELAPKKYIDEKVSTISEPQQSINEVEVSAEFTDEANRKYNAILEAVQSFTTPDDTNFNAVKVKGMGNASAFYLAEEGSMVDYVSIIGAGHHITICYRDETATATMKIENQIVIFGTHDGAVPNRTYSGVEFHNCIIFYYCPVTMAATLMKDCLCLGSGSNAITFTGSGKVYNSNFNIAPVETSVLMVGCSHTFTHAPPADISPADA